MNIYKINYAIVQKKMTYKYSNKSLKNLNTCDIKLAFLFMAVIEQIDCSIICGYRGYKDQEKAFNKGTSLAHFGQSKHNKSPSMAVDVLPYPFKGWDDLEQFDRLAEVVKRTADDMNIKIKWGGDWSRFADFPHWEI